MHQCKACPFAAFLACYCRETAFGALRAWPGGLQLGGGVNLDNAMEYLDAGASHVIVTSFVFREGRLEEDRLKALVRWHWVLVWFWNQTGSYDAAEPESDRLMCRR